MKWFLFVLVISTHDGTVVAPESGSVPFGKFNTAEECRKEGYTWEWIIEKEGEDSTNAISICVELDAKVTFKEI